MQRYMEISEVRKTYRSVEVALSQKRVKDALDILHKVVKQTQNSFLIDEIYSIEQSYAYMIKFFLEGFNDPQKELTYNQLLNSVLTLTDTIFSELSAHYYKDFALDLFHKPLTTDTLQAIMPFLDTQGQEQNEPTIMIREDNLTVLFNIIAFSPMPSQDTSAAIEALFYKTTFSETEKLNLLGAYLLSLNNYFDERKIHTLLKLSDCQSLKLSSRALVVLLLSLIKYDKRLCHYPTITNHLKSLSTSKKTKHEIKTILFQLLKTKETEKVSMKFTNEILPEMIKINPTIKKKLDLDNLLSNNPTEEALPNWEDLISESPELLDKIDEVNKLQQEGLDLLSSTFKQLKSFNFFETLRNWFIPFSLSQSHLTASYYTPEGSKMKPFYKFIDQVPSICDSDKYSMAFALSMMPMLQKDLIGKLNRSEFKEHAESINQEFKLDPMKAIKNHTNLYIQDLYRFFSAFPQKDMFENIFELDFDVYNNKFFALVFSESNMIREYGQYYFKNNYFDKAAKAFILYSSKNEPQVEVLQKIGFCYQQQKEYNKALQYYLKADFFEDNKHWNYKKIALCYRNMNQPQKALEYYKLAEAEETENLHTQASIGQCYLELQNYDEALKHYFKVEFLDPENKKVWKPIAWCCFVLGKLELSQKYYLKLLAQEQNHHDLMSYGHLLWAMGKKHQALEQYLLSSTSPGSSLPQFIENFELEVEFLKAHKIDEIEIATFLDQLRYSISLGTK